MDCVSSELPSEESTNELFQLFSIPCQQDSSNPNKQDEQDLVLVSNKRKAATAFGVKDGNATDNRRKKLIIHREIERQRRQEMTTLYSTLRFLLPLEYLKGKRSISDHMHEAVKYIKHLQNRIRELSDKREKLIKRSSSNLQASSSMPESSPDCSEDSTVVVRACMVGVEIAINTGLRRGLPLSNVLGVVVEEGLSVVNYISTKANERMLHTIVSEVNDGKSIELAELQEKLTKLIIHPPG